MISFSEAYAGLEKLGVKDPAWLKELRGDAYRRFSVVGLPTRRDEEWKYTNLRPLTEGQLPLTESKVKVSRGLGQPGLTVTSLADAFEAKGDELRRIFATLKTIPEKVFGTLGDAFLKEGVLIEVARNVVVKEPVHLDLGSGFPRVVIALAEGAELSVVESYASTLPGFSSPTTDIVLASNAKLSHLRIQAESDGAVHVSRGRAVLAQDSRLNSFNFTAGGRLTRNDFDVALTGAGAEVHLDGLYLVKDEQHVDNHTTIDHRVPDAASSQLYKGILDGKGRAVFNGKVFVRQDAQRTNAYQMNRNLLLSSEAEIDTKPELQIDADDVKCSHGAAVGQLDHDQLFYLESRGIRRAEAITLLSEAFAMEVLLKVEDPELRKRLAQLTREARA